MMVFIFLCVMSLFTYFFITWTSIYFLPLALLLGYMLGVISIVLVLVIHIPIVKKMPLTHRYKAYLSSSAAYFFNRFVLNLRIKVIGKHHINQDNILTVYANHKSYADALIMLEVIKRPTTFTPKMTVYNIPFLHQWLKAMGAFAIDRKSDRNTARAMVDAIKVVKQGMTMVIFPEGGIKNRNEEDMVAMRAGAYKVAMKAGADILPIRLTGTTLIKKRAPLRSTRILVTILPVIPHDVIKDKSTAEVADLVFKTINNH